VNIMLVFRGRITKDRRRISSIFERAGSHVGAGDLFNGRFNWSLRKTLPFLVYYECSKFETAQHCRSCVLIMADSSTPGSGLRLGWKRESVGNQNFTSIDTKFQQA
jgi:hypothetical protein